MYRQRGASMVELALVATVFLMLIFGIMDFGRALFTYHGVADAAREGSRWAMVRGSTCPAAACPSGAATSSDIQTYVRSRNGTLMTPSNITVTATWSGGGTCGAAHPDPGCVVAVTVTYPFHYAELSFADVTMTSTSKMYITQ